jgi:DNA topoisomerase-3
MKSIVLSNSTPKPEFADLFPESKKSSVPSLGVCPRCGSDVREGQKGFFCDSRACGFKLWKASKFWSAKRKELTAPIVKALLKDGKAKLTGLYSEKTGKTYDATVLLDDDGGQYVNFKMEFSNTGRAKK